jgi:uncharacterized protein
VASEDDKDLRELNEQFSRNLGFGGEGGGTEATPEELEARRSRELNEKEVKVVGVYQAPHGGAFVLLRDNQARNLPIWIDESQAVSISLAIGDGNAPARPMSHDLTKLLVEKLGGGIEYVLVDDLYNNVYYAKLALKQGEKQHEIDCRPSDAIAIGVRFKVPVYVADHVLEEGHWPVTETEE